MKTFVINKDNIKVVGKAKNVIDFMEEVLKGTTVVKQETKTKK